MRAVLPLALLLAPACAGGGGGPPSDPAPVANDQDVRGVYALAWADTFTVTLDIGGAVQEQTVSGDEIVMFNAPDGSPLLQNRAHVA